MPAWRTPPPHDVLRVTDDTTRGDLEQAINNLNASAKVCKRVVGNAEHETPWDRCHRRINALLDEWHT